MSPVSSTTAEEVEHQLSSLWCEVLRLDEVSTTTPFTEYGGSSLAATRMVLLARRRLGVDLSVREVLAGATIVDLVSSGQHTAAGAPGQAAVASSDAFRATPPQAWILARGRRSFVSGMGIVDGVIDRIALDRAAVLVSQAHDALRTRFQQTGEGWWARIDDATTASVRWLEAADLAAATAAMHAGHADFGARAEPTAVEICAVVTPDGTAIGLFADHCLIDADSIPLFFTELSRAYRGLSAAGSGPVSAELSARYQRPPAPATIAYWAEVFEGLGPYPTVTIPGAPVPADGSDPQEARTVTAELDGSVLSGFRLACRAARLTEFAGSLACLAVALARIGVSEERLGVNTASAGRFWSDTEEMIGNLAHEITLDLGPRTVSLVDAFTQVRVAMATAMRHDTVHRNDLLARLRPGADPHRRPDRCVWVAPELVWVTDGIDFGAAGPLHSLAPTFPARARRRAYPGLNLTVATGAAAHLTCEYSYVAIDDQSARALVTQWRAAIEEAATAARNGGLG